VPTRHSEDGPATPPNRYRAHYPYLALVAVVALVGVVPACARAAPETGAGNPPGASVGCGHPSPIPPGVTSRRTIVSGGISREYLLHVPYDYQPGQPRGLVLSFHGHKRTAAYQEELSGFSATDAISVYPQGLVGTDGETAWTGAPYSASADDVLFTSDLLTQLRQELCVDPARIYATGKSNGGGFVGVLACRMSDRIAAFAPVSGAFYPQVGVCNPTRPVPILDFHGAADDTIPYDGDKAKGLPSIPDWLSEWARRDGCTTPPSTRAEDHGHVHITQWSVDHCGAEITHYKIDGLGHDWPSTHPNLDSAQPTVLDATPIIMEFFSHHALARQ